MYPHPNRRNSSLLLCWGRGFCVAPPSRLLFRRGWSYWRGHPEVRKFYLNSTADPELIQTFTQVLLITGNPLVLEENWEKSIFLLLLNQCFDQPVKVSRWFISHLCLCLKLSDPTCELILSMVLYVLFIVISRDASELMLVLFVSVQYSAKLLLLLKNAPLSTFDTTWYCVREPGLPCKLHTVVYDRGRTIVGLTDTEN